MLKKTDIITNASYLMEQCQRQHATRKHGWLFGFRMFETIIILVCCYTIHYKWNIFCYCTDLKCMVIRLNFAANNTIKTYRIDYIQWYSSELRQFTFTRIVTILHLHILYVVIMHVIDCMCNMLGCVRMHAHVCRC